MIDKNLLIINQYACAPKYKAGVGERHYYLAQQFNKAGYDTTVVGSSYNHLIRTYPKVNGVVTEELIDGVRFKWIKIKTYKRGSAVGRVRTWFEFLFKLFFLRFNKQNRPDIVLISTMSLLPLIYGFFLKLKYKVKLIHEVRDIWPLTAVELGSYSKKHPLIVLLSLIEKWGFKKSDAIVSVLRGYKDYIKERFFKKTCKFEWIPNGIDDNATVISLPNTIISKIPKDKFLVVYTGSIGTANAMTYLVEAAKQLKNKNDIHFLVVGNGEERKHLIKQAQGLSNITFIDKLSKPHVLSLIAMSDICYIGWNNRKIYQYGVSANKYNDYMMMKKPILSSINSAHDPVFYANCGLVVEAENSQKIAAGLLTLYEWEEEKRVKLGENGFDYLKQNNLMSVLGDKYINLFNNLLNKSV